MQLERLVAGEQLEGSRLHDDSFWAEFGDEYGLHFDGELSNLDREGPSGSTSEAAALRRSLDEKGFLVEIPSEEQNAMAARLQRAMAGLRGQGLHPAFIYMYDEAWAVVRRGWRVMAEVFGTPVEDVVLEPSFFAYALARPAEVYDRPQS